MQNIGSQLGLYGANHHVLAALMPAPAFVQHAKTLSNTGSIAEKDLQAAARLVLFFALQLLQDLLGSRFAFAQGGHTLIIVLNAVRLLPFFRKEKQSKLVFRELARRGDGERGRNKAARA